MARPTRGGGGECLHREGNAPIVCFLMRHIRPLQMLRLFSASSCLWSCFAYHYTSKFYSVLALSLNICQHIHFWHLSLHPTRKCCYCVARHAVTISGHLLGCCLRTLLALMRDDISHWAHSMVFFCSMRALVEIQSMEIPIDEVKQVVFSSPLSGNVYTCYRKRPRSVACHDVRQLSGGSSMQYTCPPNSLSFVSCFCGWFMLRNEVSSAYTLTLMSVAAFCLPSFPVDALAAQPQCLQELDEKHQ